MINNGISILIPAYNTARYIKRCLDSIIIQDIDDETLKIIVLCDESNDGTEEILKEYAKEYPKLITVL
jgi:glycosyltransferase involved in cell wall biosynthesis